MTCILLTQRLMQADNLNNLVGIVSSQTVFKQNEINQELTESLVYIFGAYFVAVIFLIIIVNLLSYRISKNRRGEILPDRLHMK